MLTEWSPFRAANQPLATGHVTQAARRTLRTVLTRGLIGRAGIVGQIALLAVVAGLLGGALVVPAVGAVGLVTRNTADKFNNMKTGVIGELPVRSEILDSQGRLIAYFYPRGIDREPVSYNQISPIMRKAIVAIEDSR